MQLKHPVPVRLLYSEAYYNYINAYYPCDEADALRLAAILMMIRLGEFDPTKAKTYLSKYVDSFWEVIAEDYVAIGIIISGICLFQ